MATIEDLKAIVILNYLTDDMLTRMVPMIDLLRFQQEDRIFNEGDDADRFHMLKRGKVLLEQRLSDQITVSVSSIKPGFSFGWSALLEQEHYTSDAVCAEPCDILSIRSPKIKKLMDEDHSLGYRLSQRILHVVKKRFDVRTEQFIRVIRHHPDIHYLVED